MSHLVLAVDEKSADWRAVNEYLDDRQRLMHARGLKTGEHVVATVDQRDEMYAYAHAVCPLPSVATLGYFRAGAQIASTFAQVYRWYFGDDATRKRLLDFASGYGRATRFFTHDFPDDEVWASDILEGAMAFQAEQIGVGAILSARDPGDFDPRQRFDLIWVGSLFTHLPKASFEKWLRRLYECLTPTGLLAFTVHDVHHAPTDASMPEDGFLFLSLSEIPSLETSDYGATIVTRDYIKRAIENCTGRQDFRGIPRAVNFQQDLYLVARRELPSQELHFAHTPYGYLEEFVWKKDNTFFLKGWALDLNIEHEIDKIEVFLNGKLIATPVRSFERPDVVQHIEPIVGSRASEYKLSGWRTHVYIDAPIRPYKDILLARATSTSGLDFLLRCGTLNTMLTFDRA